MVFMDVDGKHFLWLIDESNSLMFQDPENPELVLDKPTSDAATADVVDTFLAPADKFTLEELTLPRLPNSIQRSSMRRQSSAFEIPSKDYPSNGLGSSHVRRQSSAFELAALIKLRYVLFFSSNRNVQF